MKTLLRTIPLAVSGLLLASGPTFSADVTVNLNTTFQTIRGFGGHQDRGWTGYNLTASDRNLAFGNGAGQLGFTIMRLRVYPNSSDWNLDLVDAKDVISRGFTVFATPWDPPGANNSTKTAGSYRETYKTDRWRIKASMYNDYAKHLNAYITHMKNNGIPLNSMSIQNEPDWDVDWTGGTPTDMYNITKAVCPQIQNTKCMSAESFAFNHSGNSDYYGPILNDANVLKDVDMFGTHFYGTFAQNDAFFDYTLYKQKGAGKEFWMTEVYTPEINNKTSNTWPLPLDVSLEINRAFTLTNMSAYVWWYLKRSYGPLYIANNQSDGGKNATASKMGYMMAQYAKYVRPGAVRVEATRKPQTDVLVSAYKKADSVIVVVLNKTTSVKTLSFAIAGLNSTSGAKITTSQSKNLSDDGSVTVSGGSFSTSFDAQSTTTLVFTGNGASSVDPKPYSVAGTAAGVYKVFDISGAMIGEVNVGEGMNLNAEVRKLSPKAGLYLAKSPIHAGSIPVSVLP